MMKRCLSLLLVVGLIVVLAVPVSAEEGSYGGWIELLETATVDNSGSNLVTTSSTSHFFRIKTPDHMWCTKVDMLITHAAGRAPKHVKVRYNGGYYTLTKVAIDDRTTRVFGDNIPDALYADLVFEIVKNDTYTDYYQILSCRVTPLAKQDYAAEAYLYRSVTDSSPLKAPANYTVDGNGADYMHTMGHLIKVHITDWRKYDAITIYGSFSKVGLNSIRPSIGNKGLPYEINYTVSNPTYAENKGFVDTNYYLWSDEKYYEHDESYQGSIEGSTVGEVVVGTDIGYGGNILYTMTIDLTGVDRSITNDLVVYFTLVYDSQAGYAANVQNVTGSINTADTSSVSWWSRFTSFMNDLFGSKDSDALDDLGSSSDSISQNTSQIHDFEQSQQAVLDNNLAAIQGTITFTNFAAALVFVQKYTNMTFSGISQYAIVFTLPLFLGLFFYLCSRIPGITRWKTPPPRSSSPKSKGGGKT